MNLIVDVLKELLGMFLADARLTAATLILVAIASGITALSVEPIFAGGVLLLGCLVLVSATAVLEARGKADQ